MLCSQLKRISIFIQLNIMPGYYYLPQSKPVGFCTSIIHMGILLVWAWVSLVIIRYEYFLWWWDISMLIWCQVFIPLMCLLSSGMFLCESWFWTLPIMRELQLPAPLVMPLINLSILPTWLLICPCQIVLVFIGRCPSVTGRIWSVATLSGKCALFKMSFSSSSNFLCPAFTMGKMSDF